MSRVLLLRHAKAGWALPGMRDFDRPLDETGRRDARAIGVAMSRHGYLPAAIFCSSALRARQTLEGVASSFDAVATTHSDALYSTDAAGYVDVIRGCGSAESVLLVGHNPMMEDVGTALSGNGDPDARNVLSGGFPTAGLAIIRFDGKLSEVSPGNGYLEAFLTPTDA